MDKLFVLDAVNFLFRSYYAIGSMTNSKGQSTSALYGFIRSVQKIIKECSATHLVAVFDGPDNKKSRRAVYADYKMHRKGAPEDLFPQFEWAAEFCKLAGIPMLCVEGVEADDTMASVAVWAKKEGAEVFLCSSDKDLMQLVGGKVFVLNVAKDNLLYDPAKVEEMYGVRPDQMLDFLAITGDASDNIPGLEGFGPKTATALLQEFGTLDEILAHPEKVKGEKKQKTLREQKDVALMSRSLATLDTSVDIPHRASFYAIGEGDPSALAEFYAANQFHSLLRELNAPSAAPQKPSKKKKTSVDKHVYRLVDTELELDELLRSLSSEEEICIDTETTGLRPLEAEMVGIGFCAKPGHASYVPCNGRLGKKIVVAALKEFFAHFKGGVYGHNLKFDWHILQNYGIDLKRISFDTILASYLIDPQNRRHNLDDLSLEHFKKVKIPIEDLIGSGKQQIGMQDVDVEKVKDYCCEDADYTARLKEELEDELADKHFAKILSDIEIPLLPILARMERRGIYLDEKKLKRVGDALAEQLFDLKKIIFREAGEEFNLNSPQQLSRILFEKLKLKSPKKRGGTSTAADVLEALAQEHPLAGHILKYRTFEKLRSTYVESLPQEINPKTGRIHCTFNQSVTATGRLSCQDPNLQNIPVRGEEGRRIRSCFEPEKKNWVYVGADYSQIELRLVAHFSEDPELLRAFRTGQDVHAYTASLIFGVPLEKVSPDMRAQAKAVNFGILYGQGPYGLSQQTGLSVQEASEFIKKYFERYPKVLQFIEDSKEDARKTGVAKTLLGRERPMLEIKNKNPAIRAAAERLAVNTPLQGTAADLIKIAMIAIDREISQRKLEGFMILQIHDELIFEVPQSEAPVFQKFVKEKMEGVLSLNVPIEASVAVGKNWGEC